MSVEVGSGAEAVAQAFGRAVQSWYLRTPVGVAVGSLILPRVLPDRAFRLSCRFPARRG